MREPVELTCRKCLELLERDTVGRIGFSTPMGPRIVPVTYILRNNAIVFRTTSYSEVGTYTCGAEVAFEIDHIDLPGQSGTSVVVLGRAEALDGAELLEIAQHGEPVPWAGGRRDKYIRVQIQELTGHAISA
jgi:nitroimidazol reductase NimA-like FMN-containing flavoprotein (pyridoxamine 5'-phosphate oxidase superfamily)